MTRGLVIFEDEAAQRLCALYRNGNGEQAGRILREANHTDAAIVNLLEAGFRFVGGMPNCDFQFRVYQTTPKFGGPIKLWCRIGNPEHEEWCGPVDQIPDEILDA